MKRFLEHSSAYTLLLLILKTNNTFINTSIDHHDQFYYDSKLTRFKAQTEQTQISVKKVSYFFVLLTTEEPSSRF